MIDVETVWDYELNGDIDPKTIPIHSKEKYHFICTSPRHHKYKRAFRSVVTEERECPDCKRIRLSIASKPKIMRFFKRENNPGLDPEYLYEYMDIDINWECPNCHYQWTSQLKSGKKRQCPCCELGKVIMPGFNDVTTIVPIITFDFLQEDNPDIDLRTIGVADKKKKINWTCHICGYKWPSTTFSRTRGHNGENKINKCPVCGGAKRAVSFDKQYPKLIPKYNEALNGKPLSKVKGTEYQDYFWWDCEIHGPYQQQLSSAIRSLTSKFNGCPKCANKLVDEAGSIKALYPEVWKEYADENFIANPSTVVSPHLTDKRLWRCSTCNELYPLEPIFRVEFYLRNKIACPACKGYKRAKGTYYGEKY